MTSPGLSKPYSKWTSGPLVTLAQSDMLDLTELIGQRRGTFRFDLINGVTGERLGTLQPVEDTPAVISHDVTQTTKRQLTLQLDSVDLAEINTLTDRVLAYMTLGGTDYPLGRFMWTLDPIQQRTGGDDGTPTLTDEMNAVDQEILKAFASTESCDGAMLKLLGEMDFELPDIKIEGSPYPAAGAWSVGARRGSILDTLAQLGDLESPWLDNNGTFRSVRVVDPAEAVPDFNYDVGTPLIMDSIMRSNSLLSAPNRFVVVGNGAGSAKLPVIGLYDLPAVARHSAFNRGFIIQQTKQMQVANSAQASAAARRLGLRSLPIEEITFSTPADPRHDSYQVVLLDGVKWLEIAWSLTCIEGGDMTHTARRAYAP